MGNSGAKYKTKKDGTVVLKNVPENFKGAFERARQNGELNLIGMRVGAENWPADAFDQLPQLWKVDVSRNNIVELPPTLHKHHGIKVLHFMRNQITRIPNSIGNMKRLMVLDVSYNQIAALPREIGECYALHTLLAGNNRIQEIPEELSRCDKLTKLHLNDNQLKGLPPALVKLSSCLTEIRLDANPLWEQLKKRPELVDVDNRNEAMSTYDIPKCLAYICAGGVNETGKPLTLILFEKYDQDRSGTIDKNELKELCYDFGYYMNEAEFELAFMKLDRDGGGTIDYNEFMTWWDSEGPSKGLKLSEKELQKRVEAAAMFKNYDSDGSGAISREEFSAMHQEMQRRGYTAKPVDVVMAEIDEDRDGEVQFNEYINWLTRNGILNK